MKQNKAIKINTVENDIDLVIKKLDQEINDLELVLEDKKHYRDELKLVKDVLLDD